MPGTDLQHTRKSAVKVSDRLSVPPNSILLQAASYLPQEKGNLKVIYHSATDVVTYVSFYPLKVPLDGTIQLASLSRGFNDVTSVL